MKNIEMEALKEKTDILVELLVSRSPHSPYGYEFRATAKDIQTGQILANCTSANWKRHRILTEKIVATSEGYKRTRKESFPEIIEVAGELAKDVMLLLTDCWNARASANVLSAIG